MDDLSVKYHFFNQVEIEIPDFACDGFVLDVGGGGEGVIGQLKRQACVAIDLSMQELEETAPGALKIVMDAREMLFLDHTFSAATAFFSMMFVKENADQQKIFNEIYRVLKPGAHFFLWDLDLEARPHTEREFFLIPIHYQVKGKFKETAYGQPWPKESRGAKYYLQMAHKTGFTLIRSEPNQNVFCMEFER